MIRRFPRYNLCKSTALSVPAATRVVIDSSATRFDKLDQQAIRVLEDYYVSGNSKTSQSSPEAGTRDTVHPVDHLDIFRDLSMTAKCSLMFPPDGHTDSPRMERVALSEDEIKARWNNLDPVDMESVERDHYLKTGQVLRTRYVRAKPSLPVPGSRLRQYLALDVLDNMDTLSVNDFGMFLSLIGSISDPNALFHRDLKFDAQFKMCKKLISLRDDEFAKIILPACVALTTFDPHTETPSRVWRRKVVPVIRRSLSDESIADLIDSVDPSINPPAYREWNKESRRSVIVSQLLSSGRVLPSNRLVSNLKKFLGNQHNLNPQAVDLIQDASCVAGIDIIY